MAKQTFKDGDVVQLIDESIAFAEGENWVETERRLHVECNHPGCQCAAMELGDLFVVKEFTDETFVNGGEWLSLEGAYLSHPASKFRNLGPL
jgi:hypothetical protein